MRSINTRALGKLVLLIILSALMQTGKTQNATIAKLKYEAAEELFADQKYRDCLDKLKEVETTLGKSNPPIDYLKIRAYEKLHEEVLAGSGNLFKDGKFEHLAHLLHSTEAFLKNYSSIESLEDKVRDIFRLQGRYDDGFAELKKPANKKAVDLLISAQKGSASAMVSLANFLHQNASFSEAFPWYFRAAEKGNEEAMVKSFVSDLILLDSYSEYVEGYEKDYVVKKVYAFLKQAVEKGHPNALLIYGQLLITGSEGHVNNLGESKDAAKGIAMIEKSYKLGNKDALRELGMVYKNGTGGIAKNYSKALAYLTEAQEVAYVAAIYMEGGYGVEQNLKKALEYHLKSPARFSTFYSIGELYSKGGPGLERNYAEAIRYFDKSIEFIDKSTNQGSIRKIEVNYKNKMQLRKAEMLFSGGFGIEGNPAKAFEMAFELHENKEAEENVRREASYLLGEYYSMVFLNDNRYSKEEKETLAASMVQCFEVASQVKDLAKKLSAMTRLSEIYEKGIGVQKNKKLAAEWTQKAEAEAARNNVKLRREG